MIFSDPADDGYGKGDVYPIGPFRSASSLQRGSVQFLSLGPGDPSTPNGPSTKNAPRLPIDFSNGFPLGGEAAARWEKESGLKREDYYATIPSLPISYASAKPILEGMGGPNAPAGWQGGLPLAYHVGPGPAEVHFSIAMDYKVRPIWNVIGTIKGTVEPDRCVLVGNHRDAWVYGAVDPSSGTAATLEMCRAVGAAVKAGWKPKRSLVYASWDAEEYGLVGSTEWAVEHAKELDERVTLLLNVDSAVSGPEIDLDGTPSLRDFLVESLTGVPDHRTGKSLKDVWIGKKRAAWSASPDLDLDPSIWTNPSSASNGTPTPLNHELPLQLNPLGSGSDYTVFLDHLGVPSVDVGFSGKYGVYHSVYDDFFWMEKFGDPEFLTHATAAKLYTLVVMRAAAADVLPFRFKPYGEALEQYVNDLRRITVRKARGVDPKEGKPAVAFEGLTKLVSAVRRFQEEAGALDKATIKLTSQGSASRALLSQLNDALKKIERGFLIPSGLPGRAWFRHSIYAPGLTTGYACWPLPGVRQAILENDAKMLETQLPILVERLGAVSDLMHAASEICKKADQAAAAGGN